MENLFKKRQERLSVFKKNRENSKVKVLRKEVPEDLFKSCPQCQQSIEYNALMRHQYVCINCQHHFPLSAYERVRQLSDDQTFQEFDRKVVTLEFADFPNYEEKISHYQKITGLGEAVIVGGCKIKGHSVVLGVMDSRFMMASMGSVVGDKITRAIEYATRKKLPLILCCASGGARMQEGIISLMQMAKTSAALERYEQKGGFYISVLTHPTTGGVSASFAMLGDIILAEPKALIGFAGKRVIERTVNEVLPDDFQRSEFLMEKGFVDRIVERAHLKEEIADLLAMHKR